MRVAVLIPVSQHETLSILERSANWMLNLEKDSMDVRIFYIVDTDSEDRKVDILKNFPVEIIKRKQRAKKAGAINDAISRIGKFDYIAIFDIDSRPDRNFLLRCTGELEANPDAFICSGPRYITNSDSSRVARIVSAEYRVLSDLYRLFEWSDSFKIFNGVIGVLRGDILKKERLNENVVCEDYDLFQRLYLKNKFAKFTKKTRVGEQAPLTLSDLYNQRVRWLTGAVEGFRRIGEFMKAEIPRSRKLSWFGIMIFPFFIFIFSFLVPFYSNNLWRTSTSGKDFLFKFFGLILHLWFLEACAIIAVLKFITRRRVRWEKMERSEV
jgi:cellulose synthase/poly-beta-1,6-N-acetylglucosamine synthase-like glycosyltransferase